MRSEILRLDDVTCRENGVSQLRHFNLQIFRGEVMGLMALDAHGIEALLALLQDNTPIHFGRVYYQETLVGSHIYSRAVPDAPAVVERQGRLIESLSVGDNIFVLGGGARRRWVVRTKPLREQLRLLEERLGLEIPYQQPAESLRFFERCAVELLRAVVSGAQLIVVRDVGRYMTGDDVARFHRMIRHFAAGGTAFLYLSGNSGEIADVCDRMALMRGGSVAKVLDRRQLDAGNLDWLVRQVADVRRDTARPLPSRAPVRLAFRALTTECFRDLALEVRAGECLAIRDEDAGLLPGLRRLVTGQEPVRAGEVLLCGKPVRRPLVRCRGFAYVAENPAASMLFRHMDGMGNLTFGLRTGTRRLAAVRRSLRQELDGALGGLFEKTLEELTVPEQYTLLFYRVLLQRPQVVFCEQPYWKSDMDLERHFARLVQLLRDHGIAVVVVVGGRYDSFPAADRTLAYRHRRLVELAECTKSEK